MGESPGKGRNRARLRKQSTETVDFFVSMFAIYKTLFKTTLAEHLQYRVALLIWLLRRACPLRPVLAAIMIGLASAAASAALLEICHAFAVAATDLLTHAMAVAIVVLVNAVMGGRLLQPALK